MSILSVFLIFLVITCVSMTSWSGSMEDVCKNFSFHIIAISVPIIHIIMFFILRIKIIGKMNTFISETCTIFELWQGPFISLDNGKPCMFSLFPNSHVFWDLVWSRRTLLHLEDSEAVCLPTDSHVLRDLAGGDLLSSDGGHHILLKSCFRLHRAGFD